MIETSILIIDDLRNPKREQITELLNVDASKTHIFVARTAIEAIAAINNHADEIEYVFFDHDLGDGPSAMLAAKFLCAFYSDIEVSNRPIYYVHTANPVGSDNLFHLLDSHFATVRLDDISNYFTVLDIAPNRDISVNEQRVMCIETNNPAQRHVFINRDTLVLGAVEDIEHTMLMSTHIVSHTLDTDIIGEDLILDVFDHNYDVVTMNYGEIISITRTTLGAMYDMK